MLNLLISTNRAKITLKPCLIDDIQQWGFPLNTGERAVDKTPRAKRVAAKPAPNARLHTCVETGSNVHTYVPPPPPAVPKKGWEGNAPKFRGCIRNWGKVVRSTNCVFSFDENRRQTRPPPSPHDVNCAPAVRVHTGSHRQA